MITGASCSGKTTLSQRLAWDFGMHFAEGDQILGSIFDLFLEEPEGKYIGAVDAPEDWEHLGETLNLDEVSRLYHRDTYLRVGSPQKLLLNGWMYSQRRWRETVYAAFRDLYNGNVRFSLVHYHPETDVFVERFIRRNGPCHPVDGSPIIKTEGRRNAEKYLRRFRNEVFEEPDAAEPVEYVEFQEMDQAGEYVEGLFKRKKRRKESAGSGKLVGHLDGLRHGKVIGWVADITRPTVHLPVEIYCQGHVVARGVADQHRDDIAAVCHGHPDHGFCLQVEPEVLDGIRRKFHLRVRDPGNREIAGRVGRSFKGK